MEARQVEVPVVDGAQLGRGAGELAHGVDELLGVKLVPEVALVRIGLLALAAAHGAMALHLAAVQEGLGLHVKELARGALDEDALLVQAANQLVGKRRVEGLRRLEAGSRKDVERDLVGVERLLLQVVVVAHVVLDRARVALALDLLAVAFHDGGAKAVRAADEDDVLGADAVAKEAREEVGGDEDAADVAKVQVLVSVWHAARDDGTLGEGWARGLGRAVELCCHGVEPLSYRVVAARVRRHS